VTDRMDDVATAVESTRRVAVSLLWLALAYPLIRALTALVLAWASAAADPLGLAR